MSTVALSLTAGVIGVIDANVGANPTAALTVGAVAGFVAL